MIEAVLSAMAITALSMTTLFLAHTVRQKDAEIRQLVYRNNLLTHDNRVYFEKDRQLRELGAYHRGLYDARETDTIYRKLLSKQCKGEQVTVMLGDTQKKEEAQ